MTSAPKITPAAVADRMREELARLVSRPRDSEREAAPDRSRMTALLDSAAAMAVLEQQEPRLLGWSSIWRYPARWVGRVVQLLSGFITVPQTHFNLGVLKILRQLTEESSRVGVGLGRLETHAAKLEETRYEQERILTVLRTQVATLERQICRDADPVRPGLSHGDDGRSAQPAMQPRYALDALYAALHSEFRGSREEIKDRARVYLPIVRLANAGTAAAPVLDIGCGRGEWLELLHDERLVGRGCDSNHVVVEQCRRLDLAVEADDALRVLRRLPAASVGAVTALHVIEHLPFDAVVELLDECLRVLRANGVAIFETPNPENFLTSTYGFYLDPLHRHPLPSPVMRFLAQSRGFCRVEVLPLQRSLAPPAPHSLPEPLRRSVEAAPDYAIVGWRP